METNLPEKYNVDLFLKQIFIEKLKKNSSYSLRAFARDLGVSPSYISQVFSAKKKFSTSIGVKLCNKNFLTSTQASTLMALIELNNTEDENEKNFIKNKIKSTSLKNVENFIIESEKFNLISEWYYFAIIELCRTKNPPKTTSQIAKRLNITINKAENAIELLLSFGYLKKENKSYSPEIVRYSSPPASKEAIRESHKNFLKMATQSIEQQSVEQRLLRGMTMAFNSKDLPKAYELMGRFINELSQISDPDHYDSVYQISTQFFRLDQKDN